jgi:hypothetical protein
MNIQTNASTSDTNTPKGVVLIAKKNKKNRFFLASRENFFGVNTVLIDSSCDTHLLPLNTGEIEKLYTFFNPKSYRWSIGKSNGIASSYLKVKGT